MKLWLLMLSLRITEKLRLLRVNFWRWMETIFMLKSKKCYLATSEFESREITVLIWEKWNWISTSKMISFSLFFSKLFIIKIRRFQWYTKSCPGITTNSKYHVCTKAFCFQIYRWWVLTADRWSLLLSRARLCKRAIVYSILRLVKVMKGTGFWY